MDTEIILSINHIQRTNGDYFEVCPLVTPPYSAANGLYVHPVAIATPFTVTGRNLLVSKNNKLLTLLTYS